MTYELLRCVTRVTSAIDYSTESDGGAWVSRILIKSSLSSSLTLVWFTDWLTSVMCCDELFAFTFTEWVIQLHSYSLTNLLTLTHPFRSWQMSEHSPNFKIATYKLLLHTTICFGMCSLSGLWPIQIGFRPINSLYLFLEVVSSQDGRKPWGG